MVHTQESPDAMTPQLWAALVSTKAGRDARGKALQEHVKLLRDLIAELEERHPKGATEIEKQVLSVVRLTALTSISLVTGVRKLLPGNVYAANALVRQMVEVEYLAWTCDHDTDEVVDWLTSSREQRLGRWQPRHLRKRAGDVFNEEDYRAHCEFGGHPTPIGIAGLHGETPRFRPTRGLVGSTELEALVHSVGTVGHLAVTAARIHPKASIAPIRAMMIQNEWASADPAAAWTIDAEEGRDPAARAAVLEFARGLRSASRG